MSKLTERKFLRPVADADRPDGLFQIVQGYLAHLRARGYTAQTLYGYERYLRELISWCHSTGLRTVQQLQAQILERYLLSLQEYRKRDGQPLSSLSKQSKLIPIRSFGRWLVKAKYLQVNPAAELHLVRTATRAPVPVLNMSDIAGLVAQPDVGKALGIRDRAMIETLFSTGIRRMELANLRINDIDFVSQTVRIRHGKGDKERLIPIAQESLIWIRRYIDEVRGWISGSEQGVLFLTQNGEPFNLAWLGTVIGQHLHKAVPGRKGACHILRHTMATMMLENGADIRYIQAILGHAQLSTTQIYTRVSMSKLHSVYVKTHPSARLSRVANPAELLEQVEFRQRAHELVDRLSDRADWNELMRLTLEQAVVDRNIQRSPSDRGKAPS